MKNKYPLLNSGMPGEQEDTRSVWYSFSHIEELYKELVYLDADGLRIYFGAYGTQEAEPGADKDTIFSNHLCLVMMPTFLNMKTGKHEDLVQEDNMEQFKLRGGSEIFIGEDGKISELTESGSRGYDQGKPCPPLCRDQEPRFPLDEEI